MSKRAIGTRVQSKDIDRDGVRCGDVCRIVGGEPGGWRLFNETTGLHIHGDSWVVDQWSWTDAPDAPPSPSKGPVVGDVIKDPGLLKVGMRVETLGPDRVRPPLTITAVIPEVNESRTDDGSFIAHWWVERHGVRLLGYAATPAPPVVQRDAPKPAVDEVYRRKQPPAPLPFKRHPECDLVHVHALPRMCLGCESRVAEDMESRRVNSSATRPLTSTPQSMRSGLGNHWDTYRHQLPYNANRR